MSPVKQFLFWAQIAGVFLLGTPQILHSSQVVEGASLSNFFLNTAYFLILTVLGWKSHTAKKTESSFRSVIICVIWCVVMGAITVQLYRNPAYAVSLNDKITLAIGAAVLFALLLPTFIWRDSFISGAAVKGVVGLATKTLPQIMMAIKIAHEGGDGIHVTFILSGFVAIGLRLIQLIVQWFEPKTEDIDGDKEGQAGEVNLKWMIINDAGNIGSWAAVSAAWAGLLWWIVL